MKRRKQSTVSAETIANAFLDGRPPRLRRVPLLHLQFDMYDQLYCFFTLRLLPIPRAMKGICLFGVSFCSSSA